MVVRHCIKGSSFQPGQESLNYDNSFTIQYNSTGSRIVLNCETIVIVKRFLPWLERRTLYTIYNGYLTVNGVHDARGRVACPQARQKRETVAIASALVEDTELQIAKRPLIQCAAKPNEREREET